MQKVIWGSEIAENYCGMTGKLWNADFWYNDFNENAYVGCSSVYSHKCSRPTHIHIVKLASLKTA